MCVCESPITCLQQVCELLALNELLFFWYPLFRHPAAVVAAVEARLLQSLTVNNPERRSVLFKKEKNHTPE